MPAQTNPFLSMDAIGDLQQQLLAATKKTTEPSILRALNTIGTGLNQLLMESRNVEVMHART